MRKGSYILFIFLFISFFHSWGQDLREKHFVFTHDTIQFDTVSIYLSSFRVMVDGEFLEDKDYFVDPRRIQFAINPEVEGQEIIITYEVTPINFNQFFYHKDTALIVSDTVQNYDPFKYSVTSNNLSNDLFGNTKLNKQGSISRGVTVGNAQNLALQSTLNLQLDGQIGPNLFMTGSISDNNIPFQPEGNTQKLQEFDQVKLTIYNDNFALIGGDFWLYKPTGYFMNYTKRAQGASVEGYHDLNWMGSDGKMSHKISGAFSRGKFGRNIIQGTEGNQGPYRLTGNDNEPFIIVLAGTEKVFIDGQLLTRGQEFDYVIDYNTAEITFTANQLVTKDKRIIVEFQYSDLNYARSLFAYNAVIENTNNKTWFNVYSEQDAKNQTIQQDLTDTEKAVLTFAGDSIQSAYANSIDSVEFVDNRVLYALVDTLGYDSVLVFTVNADSAHYSATFLNVGSNNGNYVFDKYTAFGRVYKWVEPLAGVPQGQYEPVGLLVAPQRKQMVSAGTEFKFKNGVKTGLEVAISNYDLNTFSELDRGDNQGIAVKWDWMSNNKISESKNVRLKTRGNFEYQHRHFNPIQWFRPIEFDRDWNVRYKPYAGDQYLSGAGFDFVLGWGTVGYDFENFIWGNDYLGFRNNFATHLNKNGFKAKINASWLLSQGDEQTSFLRHNSFLSQDIKILKIGFEDIHEQNEFFVDGGKILQPSSYRFYDWKAYISTLDSAKNKISLYYRERYDWFSDSLRLKQATKAQNIGMELQFLNNTKNIVRLNMNYRKLDVLDTNLFASKPENTVLGRLEHIMRLWKGMLTTTTFYEIGSGLELRKEFVFLEVASGQGTHTWIDYNNDGIKDLNEFELAAFVDQGQYIRIFVPTNVYVRTYSNQLNSSIFIKPDKILKPKGRGFVKLVTRFSDQVVYKINRKTAYEDGLQALNPFVYQIADTSLISITTSFRNTFYFNKTNSIFGANYSYQENGAKLLLSNGFDSRLNTFHEVRIRWNISKYYNLRVNGILGKKKNASDYAPSRNYSIGYLSLEPEFSYQPNTAFRLSLNGNYAEKENFSDLNETAIIRDVGFDLRYNQKKKGSFNLKMNYILISYSASTNTSLAFEMLEGLKTGNNFTWGISYQRKIAKNLQLNVNYNARKSENNKAIHSGGMELRAFF